MMFSIVFTTVMKSYILMNDINDITVMGIY